MGDMFLNVKKRGAPRKEILNESLRFSVSVEPWLIEQYGREYLAEKMRDSAIESLSEIKDQGKKLKNQNQNQNKNQNQNNQL